MGIMIRLRSRPLPQDGGLHRCWRPEQNQHLVQQVRPKVIPEPGSGSWLFAPAIAHQRTEAVDVRFNKMDRPQSVISDQLAQCLKLCIPAPVVEHGKDALFFFRQCCQAAGFFGGDGERLVDHHVLAGVQRGSG